MFAQCSQRNLDKTEYTDERLHLDHSAHCVNELARFFEWREIPREIISFPMYLGEGVEIGYWEVKGELASHKLVIDRRERDAVEDVHVDGKNLRKFADKI